MQLDTWRSRVTCRRCGVPACRVPLVSYPFAYPPNCEATFQATNSNSPRILPLRLHHLCPQQITITSTRPPDMSTTSVWLAIACIVMQPASRKWPSFHMPTINAQSAQCILHTYTHRRATRGTRHAGTTNVSFHEEKAAPRPSAVRPNIPRGNPVVVAQGREFRVLTSGASSCESSPADSLGLSTAHVPQP